MPAETFNLVSAEVGVCVSDMIRKIEEEEHIEQESILEDNRASSINRENFKTLLDVVEVVIEEDAPKKMVELFSVPNYKFATDWATRKGDLECYILEVVKNIEENHHYHYRINPEQIYLFYGDVDVKKKDLTHTDIDTFQLSLAEFLKREYEIEFKPDNFRYTINSGKKTNDGKVGSFHYSITELNAKASTLHGIMTNFKKKELGSFIDTTIYGKHLWRLPNQTLDGKGTPHKVAVGELKDFVIDLIPENSRNIDSIIEAKVRDDFCKWSNTVKEKTPIENEDEVGDEEWQPLPPDESDEIQEEDTEQPQTQKSTSQEEDIERIKREFDECLNPSRFDEYEDWFKIACALKHSDFGKKSHELFSHMSKKSQRCDAEMLRNNEKRWDGIKDCENPITVATIHMMAREDNLNAYLKILGELKFQELGLELTHKDVAKYLQYFYPDKFIWKQGKLKCFNGKFWEDGDIVMRQTICEDLYNALWDIQIQKQCKLQEHLKNATENEAKELRKKIEVVQGSLYALKKVFGDVRFIRCVVSMTDIYCTNNEIEFDNKWFLLPFKNCVYDLIDHKFRCHKYNDYSSITTGYDWIEPIQEDVEFMRQRLKEIYPIVEERECILQLLSSSLEGRALIHFIIANGCGANAKTVLDNLLLSALGNFGITGNNSILSEKKRTGANPEFANLDRKRLVIFREPPSKQKFENTIIREITGGGDFSCRQLYDKDTRKTFHGTFDC